MQNNNTMQNDTRYYIYIYIYIYNCKRINASKTMYNNKMQCKQCKQKNIKKQCAQFRSMRPMRSMRSIHSAHSTLNAPNAPNALNAPNAQCAQALNAHAYISIKVTRTCTYIHQSYAHMHIYILSKVMLTSICHALNAYNQ